MNREKIGKFIKELRKKQNLTQEELGEKLNVSSKSVSRWENGKCMPDLSLLIPISKELNITVSELISGEKVKSENYQESLEQNAIHLAIHLRRKNFIKVLKMFSITLLITCTIMIIGFGLFVIEHDVYLQEPIYLDVNKLDIKLCDLDENYYMLIPHTKDNLGAHSKMEKDFDKKKINFSVYRTRIENRNNRLLGKVGLGNTLIEKSIENIYYDNHLIWNTSMEIEKCN